jgi:hypothetical protein
VSQAGLELVILLCFPRAVILLVFVNHTKTGFHILKFLKGIPKEYFVARHGGSWL